MKHGIGIIALWIFFYLCAAFMRMDLNSVNWSTDDRGLFILFSTVGTMMYIAGVLGQHGKRRS